MYPYISGTIRQKALAHECTTKSRNRSDVLVSKQVPHGIRFFLWCANNCPGLARVGHTHKVLIYHLRVYRPELLPLLSSFPLLFPLPVFLLSTVLLLVSKSAVRRISAGFCPATDCIPFDPGGSRLCEGNFILWWFYLRAGQRVSRSSFVRAPFANTIISWINYTLAVSVLILSPRVLCSLRAREYFPIK